jgi:CHAT domain-containing protein
MPQDGGEGALSALRDLEARVGAPLPNDVAPRQSAALARLALAVARDPEVLARSQRGLVDVLRLATRAAVRGGVGHDIATAHLLLADALGSDRFEFRPTLEAALEYDLGDLAHGPAVVLARLAIAQSRFHSARALLARAQTFVDAGGANLWLQPDLYDARARMHIQLGLLDLAVPDIEAAERLYQRVYGRILPECLILQRDFALAAEDFAVATAIGTQILDLGASPAQRPDALVALALSAHLDPARAPGDSWPLALARLATVDDMSAPKRLRAHCTATFIAADLGDVEVAVPHMAAADRIVAGLRDQLDLNTRAEVASARARLALALYATQPRMPQTHAALHTSLRELNGDGVVPGLCAELLAVWQREPVRVGGLGFLQFAQRRNLFAARVAVMCALAPTCAAEALATLLPAQAMGSQARRLSLAPGDLREVQARLVPPNGGMLVFLPAHVGPGVFAVTRSEITYWPLPSTRGLVDDLRRHRELLLARAHDAEHIAGLQRTGRAIWDLIVPPQLQALVQQWQACVVVGRALLNDLVFEALPGRERWLGCELAISYLPSLQLGLLLAQRPSPAPASPDRVLLAATRADSEFALPLRRNDLEALARLWPRTRLLAGTAATRERLRDAVSHARVLHVIAHGVSGAGELADERPYGLMLHDGVLTCGRIEQMEAVGELVVLGVCGGATGPQRRGDDASGQVASAFLFAGARAVVAADAEIELQQAVRVSTILHRELRNGAGVAEAMRHARAQEMQAGHHAGILSLGVIGLGDLVLATPPDSNPSAAATRPALMIGLAGLVGAIVLWRVRRRAAHVTSD